MSTVSNINNAPSDVHLSASIFVAKKSQDLQAQNVATLLNSVATPPSNPAHLGNNIDVRA